MNICIFGDSITWGMYDPEDGGWATRLRNYFESKGSREVDVYNLGISGDNSQGLLLRMETEMNVRRADVVIIAIGINDSQYVISENKNQTSLSEFRNNLKELVSIARQRQCKVLLIGLTLVEETKVIPLPWNQDKKYTNEYVRAYDQVIREVATQEHTPYTLMMDTIATEDLYDGIHPNSSGHQKMFQVIKESLKNLMP